MIQPNSLRKQFVSQITPFEKLISSAELQAIQDCIDNKVKPLQALGRLETLARCLVVLWHSRKQTEMRITAPLLLIFAGDHGIAQMNVSIAKSEVTSAMVQTILAGKAAVSVFCHQQALAYRVVDCGLKEPQRQLSGLLERRLGYGTAPLHMGPAMSYTQMLKGLENGRQLVNAQVQLGMDLLCLGEIGIGNTTSAAALMAALTKLPVEECTDYGSGIDNTTLVHKCSLVTQALTRLNNIEDITTETLLTEFGGFEIVTMVGAIIAAAEQKIPVVLDGFVTTVAALYACQLAPEVSGYLFFAHCSSEKGHRRLLQWLNVEPLMSLELRIGEGVGAVLALPLLRSALSFYRDMASLSERHIVL